jgi:hypothetical protein
MHPRSKQGVRTQRSLLQVRHASGRGHYCTATICSSCHLSLRWCVAARQQRWLQVMGTRVKAKSQSRMSATHGGTAKALAPAKACVTILWPAMAYACLACQVQRCIKAHSRRVWATHMHAYFHPIPSSKTTKAITFSIFLMLLWVSLCQPPALCACLPQAPQALMPAMPLCCNILRSRTLRTRVFG